MNITCIFFFLIIIHIFLISHFFKIIYTLKKDSLSHWCVHDIDIIHFFKKIPFLWNQPYTTHRNISQNTSFLSVFIFHCSLVLKTSHSFLKSIHHLLPSHPSMSSHTGEERRRREGERVTRVSGPHRKRTHCVMEDSVCRSLNTDWTHPPQREHSSESVTPLPHTDHTEVMGVVWLMPSAASRRQAVKSRWCWCSWWTQRGRKNEWKERRKRALLLFFLWENLFENKKYFLFIFCLMKRITAHNTSQSIRRWQRYTPESTLWKSNRIWQWKDCPKGK